MALNKRKKGSGAGIKEKIKVKEKTVVQKVPDAGGVEKDA